MVNELITVNKYTNSLEQDWLLILNYTFSV